MSATSDLATRDRFVFLHGFTQTHHHWHRCAQLIAARLPDRPTLALIDLPGHGLSVDDHSGFADAGAALVQLAGSGTYVGYSMGGRLALGAAVAGHAEIRRLVLIGASPGIADAHERDERRRADAALADRIEAIGVDAFLDEWLATPLFASLPPDRSGLEHRRRNTAGGLARSLRLLGTGEQESSWHRLGDVTIPVLVVAGALDQKFTDIGHRMGDELPDATFVSIPRAGHAAHAEQPEAVADAIAGWVAARS
jgi:2-succinyl-6-hydroxy-2,4-cyclohexadiene-1-carboxylate synthase